MKVVYCSILMKKNPNVQTKNLLGGDRLVNSGQFFFFFFFFFGGGGGGWMEEERESAMQSPHHHHHHHHTLFFIHGYEYKYLCKKRKETFYASLKTVCQFNFYHSEYYYY